MSPKTSRGGSEGGSMVMMTSRGRFIQEGEDLDRMRVYANNWKLIGWAGLTEWGRPMLMSWTWKSNQYIRLTTSRLKCVWMCLIPELQKIKLKKSRRFCKQLSEERAPEDSEVAARSFQRQQLSDTVTTEASETMDQGSCHSSPSSSTWGSNSGEPNNIRTSLFLDRTEGPKRWTRGIAGV